MKTYHVKLLRLFEVDIEAENLHAAEVIAGTIVREFPTNTCRLLSILADDYVEPPEPEKTPPRTTTPRDGGTPGTPVVNLGPPLVDQIAEAA